MRMVPPSPVPGWVRGPAELALLTPSCMTGVLRPTADTALSLAAMLLSDGFEPDADSVSTRGKPKNI